MGIEVLPELLLAGLFGFSLLFACRLRLQFLTHRPGGMSAVEFFPVCPGFSGFGIGLVFRGFEVFVCCGFLRCPSGFPCQLRFQPFNGETLFLDYAIAFGSGLGELVDSSLPAALWFLGCRFFFFGLLRGLRFRGGGGFNLPSGFIGGRGGVFVGFFCFNIPNWGVFFLSLWGL